MDATEFKVLDCTVRDGGYINSWRFHEETVREIYSSVSQAGVDYMEIGFHGSTSFFSENEYGLWRFSPEDAIRRVTRNIKGCKLALMVDYTKFRVDDLPDASESIVSLIRMATHKDYIYDALETSKLLAGKGYEVAVNAMGIVSYTEEELKALASTLQHYSDSVTYFYLADSYGSLRPNQIELIMAPFRSLAPTVKLGLHPHNNMQLALSNTLEARRSGISIVDCTLYGMGRGAGNLPTECLIGVLESEKPHRYNVLPVAQCAVDHVVPISKIRIWGYQIPYMFTGIMSCHPNYALHLMKRGGLRIQDMESAFRVVSKTCPTKFDPELMDTVLNVTSQQNGSQNQGYEPQVSPSLNSARRNAVASYKGAHSGKIFLVIANGPTLRKYEEKITAFIETYKPIVLAANFCNTVTPDYHAFVNVGRYNSYKHTVSPDSKLLLSEEIVQHDSSASDHLLLLYDNYLKNRFDIDEPTGRINTNCCTVSVLLLGVAIVMGGTEIYAVGMDGYIDTDDSGNFLYYGKESNDEQEEADILKKHQWCAKHIGEINTYLKCRGHAGISILTPTSYKTWFTSIDRFV